MEQLHTVNIAPLVRCQSELAPYLAGLNVGQALEEFGKLADLVLSSEHEHNNSTDDASPAASPGQHYFGPGSASSSSAGWPGSPGGASLYSSSAYSAGGSSQWPASPVHSDRSFCSFASSSSSSSSWPSGRYSSASSSAGSSVCGDHLDASSPEPRRRRSGPASKLDRRRQNASAAERYRRKLRGRRCGLDEELELERERNASLRRAFESKLELYREFADLLAANTRDPGSDLELARLGARSLANILERICPSPLLAERQRAELERLRAHFGRVLGAAGARPAEPEPRRRLAAANGVAPAAARAVDQYYF